MESIGINNMIDILSGKRNLYMPDEADEKNLKQMLIGHSITKVNEATLELDNGIQLEFIGNEGCLCGSGEYDISELNDCENIITNVEFTDEFKGGYAEAHSYKIFVYAENKKIKLLQCDGTDGNGYYGTGYHINIKLKKDEVK